MPQEFLKLKNPMCGGEPRTHNLEHLQFFHLCIYLSSSHSCSSALIYLIFLRKEIIVFRFPVLPLLTASIKPRSQNKVFFTNHHSCLSGSHRASMQITYLFELRELCCILQLIIKEVNIFPRVLATGWVIHPETNLCNLPLYLYIVIISQIFLHHLIKQTKLCILLSKGEMTKT